MDSAKEEYLNACTVSLSEIDLIAEDCEAKLSVEEKVKLDNLPFVRTRIPPLSKYREYVEKVNKMATRPEGWTEADCVSLLSSLKYLEGCEDLEILMGEEVMPSPGTEIEEKDYPSPWMMRLFSEIVGIERFKFDARWPSAQLLQELMAMVCDSFGADSVFGLSGDPNNSDNSTSLTLKVTLNDGGAVHFTPKSDGDIISLLNQSLCVWAEYDSNVLQADHYKMLHLIHSYARLFGAFAMRNQPNLKSIVRFMAVFATANLDTGFPSNLHYTKFLCQIPRLQCGFPAFACPQV